MKQIKTRFSTFAGICMLLFIGCTDSETASETNDRDTAATAATADTPSLPAYDPAMEPLTVGARMSKKIGDTLGVRMYEFTAKPGESWALHTHPDHTVYVLQGGKMALYMREAGRQDTLTFPTGMGLVSGPLTDSGKNIGKTTIKMVITDIYRPRGK